MPPNTSRPIDQQADSYGKGDLRTRIDAQALASFRSLAPGGVEWSEERQVLVNPTTFKETLQAHYSLRPVLGLSHEVVQYVRTGTRRIAMEVWLSLHLYLQKGWPERKADGTPDPAVLMDWRNWFESLMVPAGLGLAPPQVEFLWPHADLYFIGVMDSLNVEYERFSYTGAPIEIKLELSMIEVLSGLMTSDRVMKNGLGYASAGSTSPASSVPAAAVGGVRMTPRR